MLNANGDPARFASFGLPVVADSVPDFAGPLAGILAGLDWVAANKPGTEWVVSVPGDCPFLPRDLVAKLHAARITNGKLLACAHSGDWRHPVVGLWHVGAARGPAPRRHGGGPAQDRGVDRAPRRRARRLADRAGRSVLQCEHAGGCGESDRARGSKSASSPPAPNTAESRSSRPWRSRSHRHQVRQDRPSRSARK